MSTSLQADSQLGQKVIRVNESMGCRDERVKTASERAFQ